MKPGVRAGDPHSNIYLVTCGLFPCRHLEMKINGISTWRSKEEDKQRIMKKKQCTLWKSCRNKKNKAARAVPHQQVISGAVASKMSGRGLEIRIGLLPAK